MIIMQGRLPRKIYVAVSGGVDSMTVAHFLAKNHDVTGVFVHHMTKNSWAAYDFLQSIELPFAMDYHEIVEDPAPDSQSMEEYWRNERYRIFTEKYSSTPVITAHTLDDCVETWLWSSMHGEGKIIPYMHKNVVRPFRRTRKSELIEYAKRHVIDWVEDESNTDVKYVRNRIRHNIMPEVLHVNPGIHKVIDKKVSSEFNDKS